MGWFDEITESVGGIVRTTAKVTLGIPASIVVDGARMATGKEPKHTEQLIDELLEDDD